MQKRDRASKAAKPAVELKPPIRISSPKETKSEDANLRGSFHSNTSSPPQRDEDVLTVSRKTGTKLPKNKVKPAGPAFNRPKSKLINMTKDQKVNQEDVQTFKI